MVKRLTDAERFATATDVLLRGSRPDGWADAGLEEELGLAQGLRHDAGAGVPDPAFVDGLRAELVLLAAGRQVAGVVRYATIETPVGTVAVAHRAGRVVYCNFVERLNLTQFERGVAQTVGDVPVRDAALPADMARAFRDHLSGVRRFTDVDLSWLPPFQRRVLEKTAEIPWGEVRPYGWIAREIGSPGATRAVGTALGHNPIPLLIPCHRVVRSDGSLGEYSGGGPAMKIRVLEMEGAPVDQLLAAARRGERLRGDRHTHVVCYPSCRTARNTTPEDGAPFASLAQATSAGYRPCESCRPA